MSLQNILNPAAYDQDDKKLYCNRLDTTQLRTENIVMGPGGLITTPELIVTDEAKIGGTNFVTPDNGAANFTLKTNGLGQAYWDSANFLEIDPIGASDLNISVGTGNIDSVITLANEFPGSGAVVLSGTIIIDDLTGVPTVGNPNQCKVEIAVDLNSTDLNIVSPSNLDLIPGSVTAIVRNNTNDSFAPAAGFMQVTSLKSFLIIVYVDAPITGPDINRQLDLSFIANFKM